MLLLFLLPACQVSGPRRPTTIRRPPAARLVPSERAQQGAVAIVPRLGAADLALGADPTLVTATSYLGVTLLTGFDDPSTPVWMRELFGGPGFDHISIAVDQTTSDAYVIGDIGESRDITIGDETLTTDAQTGGFIAAFGRGGDLRWAQLLPGITPMAAATNPAGDVYLTGSFGEAEGRGLFLAAFTPGGQPRWELRWENGGRGAALAVDARGNVFLAASIAMDIDLGGGPLHGTGNGDVLVASFTSEGIHRWSRVTSGEGSEDPMGIEVDRAGAFYVAGDFGFSGRRASFGGPPVEAAAINDIFVASYTNEGAFRWSTRAGTGRESSATALCSDPNGGVIVAGLERTPSPESEPVDVPFVVSVSGEGRERWRRAWHGGRVHAVALVGDDLTMLQASDAGFVLATLATPSR